MQPLVFSKRAADERGDGWMRCGSLINYRANRFLGWTGAHLFTLSFDVVFEFAEDTCWFAPAHPYTLSDMRSFVRKTISGKDVVRWTSLCKTDAGNDCVLLTITNFNATLADVLKRRYVFVTARVHPGETQASYVCEGLVEYLLGDSVEVRALRDNYVFKVVPMLNPDGVVEGNNRVSLTGLDLNRVWKTPRSETAPTIFAIKWLMKQVSADSAIALFVDLHGHSRKKVRGLLLLPPPPYAVHQPLSQNMFAYGCEPLENGKPFSERLFPFLLSRRAPCFSFPGCSFKVEHGTKRGSARMTVWKEMAVLNSFTIEAPFSGIDIGPHTGLHVNPALLRETGAAIGATLVDYSLLMGPGEHAQSNLAEVMADLRVACGASQ